MSILGRVQNFNCVNNEEKNGGYNGRDKVYKHYFWASSIKKLYYDLNDRFFFSIIIIYTKAKVHTTVPQQYSVLLGKNKMLKYKYQ